MKIAIVINSLEGGGAERVACTLASHFDALGHEVVIVTLHGGTVAYALPPGVRVIHLESRRLLRGLGRLAFLPVSAIELSRVLKEIHAEATISLLTRANLTHVMTRWLGNKEPIYISHRSHAEAEFAGAKQLLGWAVRKLYPKADRIIAISEGVKQSLVELGIPRSKITTIHNPQQLDQIGAESIRAPRRDRTGPFRIVMAGRLSREKDYPTMLRALSILVRERRLDVQLVVLGDGPDRAQLHAAATELGVARHIEWRGWVSDIYRVMATCDAFVFTSIFEGFGNVLVEAMACGLPVVSTACPSGPVEILQDGQHGILVPIGDSVAIANAVERLASDPQYYEEYRAKALSRSAAFDVAIIAEDYLRVLEARENELERESDADALEYSSPEPRVLILHDGGSLKAMEQKGNLGHYVETLYNPANFFRRAHIAVFDRADLVVKLKNPTLRVHYLHNLHLGERAGRIGRYIGRGLTLPSMILQTAMLVRSQRITVIRARNAYLAGVICVIAGKLTDVPVVVSLGGDNRIAQELLGRYYTYSRFLSFRIEEFALRNADRVFCTNEFTRQYAIRLGVAADKARVVPHRVDVNLIGKPDPAAARVELGIGNRPMVLFVGRFEPDKQVDVVVEAIPGILAEHATACFVFIGDGSMRPSIEARCRELGILDSVIFAGYQPRDRIAKYLAAASVVWIPMSGFVIYEAAAAQRPIVAFDVEWHSEFVIHNRTGLLVKDRSVPDLAAAINTVLGDPQLARRLAVNGERHFIEECNQAKLAEKEILEYVEVMGIARSAVAKDIQQALELSF